MSAQEKVMADMRDEVAYLKEQEASMSKVRSLILTLKISCRHDSGKQNNVG